MTTIPNGPRAVNATVAAIFALIFVVATELPCEAQPREVQPTKVEKQIAKLDKAKADFDQALINLEHRLLGRFDEAQQIVVSSEIPIDERTRIAKIIADAKYQFESKRRFSRIGFFQADYMAFAEELFKDHKKLLAEYDQTFKALPKKDPKITVLTSEIRDYHDAVHEYDSMKVGTTWVGYRSDFDWGPVKK
ncbi:MAG: hypothetical protein ABL921_33165, partial [Pirellula sp.]